LKQCEIRKGANSALEKWSKIEKVNSEFENRQSSKVEIMQKIKFRDTEKRGKARPTAAEGGQAKLKQNQMKRN